MTSTYTGGRGMTVTESQDNEVGEDGLGNPITDYTFSQSGIKKFMACPEQARQAWFHGVTEDDNDATVLGQALHMYIEERLKGDLNATSAYRNAETWLQVRNTNEDFKRIGIKSANTMLKYLEAMSAAFEVDVLPGLPPVDSTEVKFERTVDVRDSRFLKIKGTIDMIDTFDGVWDWKSAKDIDRQYPQWEIDRFHIQPTVYTLAVALGADSMYRLEDLDPVDFAYGIMDKSGSSRGHLRETTRGPAQWLWLIDQLWAIVDLYERLGPDSPWPLNDQGWHCSAKWCPSWEGCKGARVDA